MRLDSRVSNNKTSREGNLNINFLTLPRKRENIILIGNFLHKICLAVLKFHVDALGDTMHMKEWEIQNLVPWILIADQNKVKLLLTLTF